MLRTFQLIFCKSEIKHSFNYRFDAPTKQQSLPKSKFDNIIDSHILKLYFILTEPRTEPPRLYIKL